MSLVIDDLPVPPSTNNLFRTFADPRTGKPRRAMSKAYREWREMANLIVSVAGKGIAGRVTVCIDVFGGIGYPVTRDLDNTAKAVLDALVQGGRIDGDDVRTIRALSLAYHAPLALKDRARIRVSIYSLEDANV